RRRAIKKPLDPLPARLLQHNQRAGRVDLVVFDWPAQRTANTLDGEMEHTVTAAHRQFDCDRIENGTLDDAQPRGLRGLGEILAPAGREIIEDGNGVCS